MRFHHNPRLIGGLWRRAKIRHISSDTVTTSWRVNSYDTRCDQAGSWSTSVSIITSCHRLLIWISWFWGPQLIELFSKSLLRFRACILLCKSLVQVSDCPSRAIPDVSETPDLTQSLAGFICGLNPSLSLCRLMCYAQCLLKPYLVPKCVLSS